LSKRLDILKPSFYAGGVWAAEFAHWGYVRLAALGGLISGYNYGRRSIGPGSRSGSVLEALIMAEFGI
jgi:hypothetical protein